MGERVIAHLWEDATSYLSLRPCAAAVLFVLDAIQNLQPSFSPDLGGRSPPVKIPGS